MPGSFQVVPNTAQKPKPKVKVQVRPDDDDPFATSPSAPSEADHPSASRPIPKVTQRPFGGVVHYSSPPAKGRKSDTESDHDDDDEGPPSWPPIRIVRKSATQSLPNIPTVEMQVAVTDARQQQHDLSPHHSSQQVLDKAAPTKLPVNAVASSSKVTLDGPTNGTPAPRQNVQSIDLAAIEKQRRSGLRRRTSRKAELATKDKLSTKNLEKHGKMHRQIAHANHRHSIAGTRPNMKADDLRVESLRRRALSSSNSSASLAPAPLSLIPAKQGAIISGSTISSDELDLVATLGVQSAISILAQATHFSEEVVRGVWETTKSLKQSERVLLAMREAAQSAMHKALSMTDEDGRSMNVEVESAADATPSKMAMSIVGDDPGDHPPKVIRGRRQSPPFIYTPSRPGEQPDSPYVPPRSTRAAQAARRISRSRRSLAIEMESRRVSQTNKSATPEANSDEVHDVFRWDETHDELFLRACVDTEEELAELERQFDDDRVLREHFLRILTISHPNDG
ncbi:hypothetical protein ONZ45_g15768 [Pleurotus djamor]|nr:hypothetical protein ONZ45_g15768 [Pleurotus djamor]